VCVCVCVCVCVRVCVCVCVRRVYSASPWNAENTMRAVYAIAHHWLKHNAKWNDKHYTDTVIPPELQPEGYKPTWSTDIHLLQVRGTGP
jgi:hypothetical protein